MQYGLTNWKSKVDRLDIFILETTPVDLSKLLYLKMVLLEILNMMN